MTLRDTATQEEEVTQEVDRHMQRSMAGSERLTFRESVPIASRTIGTPIEPAIMEHMPAHKRRCMEERVIDVAMGSKDAGFPLRSETKWQVLIQEAHARNGQGEVWADMTGEWAGCCEQVFEDI